MEEYLKIIKDNLNTKNIELISQSSNLVFKVLTSNNEYVYVKFYLNKSSHIDHELYLYDILDHNYLKELIKSSDNPKFAVFKELIGKTLDELSEDELHNNCEAITDSVIYFYETISKVKVKNFGLLDNNLNGTSKSFQDFIYNRQTETQEILKDYPILNSAFSLIYDKYKDL